MSAKNVGLRNIEVADTKVCAIDGENGKLIYRGYDILDLAKNSSFEETAYLLLFSDLPTKEQIENFKTTLISKRDIPSAIIKSMSQRPKSASSMDVLQSTISMLPDDDKNINDDSKEANHERGMNLIAKFPTMVATWDRIRKNLPLVKPSDKLSHSANFLYMLTGKEPDREFAKDFDICLVLHAEHSFNASTFAAREVASTRAHMYASIAAAIGALSGELHGGANVKVMQALREIGSVENVEMWVKTKFDVGERIMGMGHAVYKTDDPRAKVLREMSKRLASKLNSPLYDITKKLEDITREEMKKRKDVEIFANVDLYSASVYYMMGIELDLNSPIFSIARMAGWAAHVIEEKFAEAQPKPMLYRPTATYVGKYCGPLGCEYRPLQKRRQ
ncbi:MAG: citrate/2-methylcitrate synthase [Nitrososphaerales archaeon]